MAKLIITIILLISLLLPTRAAVGFGDSDAPRLGASVVDADTGGGVDIGTKNILVTTDIPTHIFEKEREKGKVDLRVIRAGEAIFEEVEADSSDRGLKSATPNGEGGERRTMTEYLFALDSPLEKDDKVEVCFALLPSGRGGCSGQIIGCIPDSITSSQASDSQILGNDMVEIMLSTATENMEPGNLVVISHEKNPYGIPITKSTQVYQKGLIGVVSSDTEATLGKGLPENDGYKPFPLALAGTVPVKVSTENGPIEPGDPITSSSVPGVGMKATSPGPIIGKALEALPADSADMGGVSGYPQNPPASAESATHGKIMVIISLGWYPGDAIMYEGLSERTERIESELSELRGLVSVGGSYESTNPFTNLQIGGNATSTELTMSSGENLLNAPTTVDSSGNIIPDESGIMNYESGIRMSQLAVDSDLNMRGYGIINVSKLAGLKWSIGENGDFVTEGGIYAKKDVQTEGIFKTIIRVAKSLLGGGEALVVENSKLQIPNYKQIPNSKLQISNSETASSTPREVYSWFEGNAAEASRLDVFGEDEESVSFITYGLSSSRNEVVISGSGRLTSDNSQFSILNFQSNSNDPEQFASQINGASQIQNASSSDEVIATVLFDSSFTAIISEEEPIRVIVTPTSRINGSLYVAEKSIYGFVVKELHSQDEGARFDWVVIARRKALEGFTADSADMGGVSGYPQNPLESAESTDEVYMLPVEEAPLNPPVSAESATIETVVDTGASPGDNSFTFHCAIDGVSSSNCTFQCQVNNRGFVPCESPKNYGTLLPGEYTFKVYAVAPDGKYDPTPARFTWTVASEPPLESSGEDLTGQAEPEPEPEPEPESLTNATSTPVVE